MVRLYRSSKLRFGDYRQRIKERELRHDGDLPHDLQFVRQGRSTDRQRSFFSLFGAFWGLLYGHRGMIVLSLATAGISTLLALVPLYGTKLVFDNVLSDLPLTGILERLIPEGLSRRGLLAVVAGAMVSFALVSLAVGMVGRWQMTRMTKRVQASVRRRLFEHTVRLPLHRVQELKAGGVATLLREDAGGIGDLLFAMLYNPFKAVIQLLGCLAVLTWTDWRLLVGSLILLPIVWLTHRTWIGRIRPMYRDIRATRQDVSAHATEVFGGMRVVRGFNRQRSEAGRFTRSHHFLARQELLAWWWARGVDIAWSVLIPAASAGILLYGGLAILRDMEAVDAGLLSPTDAFTSGDLVLFLAYLGWLLEPIATLAASATQFQNNLAGLDRVLDIFNEPREFEETGQEVWLDRASVDGAIRLHDVRFRYPSSNQMVIDGVDVDVKPGQTVALVGPSGSGKTTLCNLIARFFDPTAGNIELDGVDLRRIEIESYRGLLGIVEQDVFLFDGTIAENIAYARREAARVEIEAAAQAANADEFIEGFEDGYETLIGERGVKLSGGQRQRLAIARALLADPKILILDEATSNLDTQSERLIQLGLTTLLADRTCFVIAHRLSTIQHADLILVLEGGRIVERGRHEELIAQSGRYRRMVELQTHPPDASDDPDGETLSPSAKNGGVAVHGTVYK